MTMINGQIIGYVRVSSLDQNIDRQLEGKQLDKIFIEQASGKDANRPKLAELINYARQGDMVVVHAMDRLARNLGDLRNIVKNLTQKGVKIEFLKENLTFSGDDAPMSVLLLNIMGAMAEFERSLIRERQREGIELAKRKGLYGGRKKVLSDEQWALLKEKIAKGGKVAELARELKISRETIYKKFRQSDQPKS